MQARRQGGFDGFAGRSHKYSVSVCCYYSSGRGNLTFRSCFLAGVKLSVVRGMDHITKKGRGSTSLYKSLIIKIATQTPLKTVYRVMV